MTTTTLPCIVPEGPSEADSAAVGGVYMYVWVEKDAEGRVIAEPLKTDGATVKTQTIHHAPRAIRKLKDEIKEPKALLKP